jgi:hypothetical protein
MYIFYLQYVCCAIKKDTCSSHTTLEVIMKVEMNSEWLEDPRAAGKWFNLWRRKRAAKAMHDAGWVRRCEMGVVESVGNEIETGRLW